MLLWTHEIGTGSTYSERVHERDETWKVRAKSSLLTCIRQPLLQLTCLGALVFALEAWLRPVAPTAEDEILVLDAQTRSELLALFRQRQQRAPTPAETEQLIARWAEDEALFQQGLRDELVKHDPVLRDQLIARMRSLLQDSLPARAPSDADLHGYYAAHSQRYRLPARYDFMEYVIPSGPGADDQARTLLRELQRPDIRALSEPMVHNQRPEPEIRALYGDQVAQKLARMPLATWSVVRSTRALHVVQVQARHAAGEPSFDALRPQLRVDWTAEQRRRSFQEQLRRLTAQWSVRVDKG